MTVSETQLKTAVLADQLKATQHGESSLTGNSSTMPTNPVATNIIPQPIIATKSPSVVSSPPPIRPLSPFEDLSEDNANEETGRDNIQARRGHFYMQMDIM